MANYEVVESVPTNCITCKRIATRLTKTVWTSTGSVELVLLSRGFHASTKSLRHVYLPFELERPRGKKCLKAVIEHLSCQNDTGAGHFIIWVKEKQGGVCTMIQELVNTNL